MALIRSFNIGGVEIPNAYYVITGLTANKRLTDTVVTVVTPEVPAVPPVPAVDEVPEVSAVLDEQGAVVTPAVPAIPGTPYVPGIPAVPAVTTSEVVPSQIWDCSMVISVFKNKAERDLGNPPIAYVAGVTPNTPFSANFPYDSTSQVQPVLAGYTHLMSQPYFADATVDASS